MKKPEKLHCATPFLPEILTQDLSLSQKSVALFCDFDGTLTPIVRKPEQAVLSMPRRAELLSFLKNKNVLLAVVSGRSVADLKKLTKLHSRKNLVFAGNHGIEIIGPGFQFVYPAAAKRTRLLKILKAKLLERIQIQKWAGLMIEDKKYSVAFHYRCVDHHLQPRMAANIHESFLKLNTQNAFQLKRGKKVIEIVPRISWDKGKSVQWILNRFYGPQWERKAHVFFLGDDQTDEDAFHLIRGSGAGVLVSRQDRPTYAQYRLQSPKQVYAFIKKLGEHRK